MLFDIFALFFLVLSQLCAWTAWSELPFEGPARKHFRSHAQHSLAWLRRNTYLFTENWRPARLTSGASTTNRCEAAIATDDDDSTAIQHPWTQAQPTRTWLRRKLHLFTENWRPVWPRVDASCTRSCNAALVAEDCGHPADQHTQRSQQILLSKMHVIWCLVWGTIMVCIVDLRGFQPGPLSVVQPAVLFLPWHYHYTLSVYILLHTLFTLLELWCPMLTAVVVCEVVPAAIELESQESGAALKLKSSSESELPTCVEISLIWTLCVDVEDD